MKQRGSFTTINDLLHAIIVVGAFALTAYGLSDQLFDFGSREVIAVLAYGMAVVAIGYGAVLAQSSLTAVRATLTQRRSRTATISL